MTPVTLNTLSWGRAEAPLRALLVHGLGSNAPLMWRFGTTLADAGWHATAVDLRGHGLSPRALEYAVEAHATDIGATTPEDGTAWDLVIGHSLGAASAIVAATADPDWARRLVLIDPAVIVTSKAQANMRGSMANTVTETVESVRAAHPEWHPQDVELKVLSVQQGSPWAVEQSNMHNEPWDVRAAASRLTIPTHVIAGDPAVMSIFAGALAAEVLQNPVFSMSVIEGAGHSPHRDKPEATMTELLRVLGE